MAEERKGYKAKEAEPEYNRFHSNAEDVTFYDAEPLTDEERKEAAEMWDAVVVSATPGKRVPYPDTGKVEEQVNDIKN